MTNSHSLRAFSAYGWHSGKLADCDPNFPTDLYAWHSEERLTVGSGATHFGFVVEGPATLTAEAGTFTLKTGMYFSVPGEMIVRGGRGIVMSRREHSAFFSVGGPVEARGRLRYIDGCTDSLLIAPIRRGDPCLNLLYFPQGIDQTEHTHPSDRIGCIYRGRGQCVTPDGVVELEPGMIFRIHADGPHKFRTLKGADMAVIAYHPDSDFGPTDQVHPMINRTMVGGVSASKVAAIHTA